MRWKLAVRRTARASTDGDSVVMRMYSSCYADTFKRLSVGPVRRPHLGPMVSTAAAPRLGTERNKQETSPRAEKADVAGREELGGG